ncbi:hypothetical protein F2Q70_00030601 [Brassica cretica]|uniref:Uncharacterized protein n=1 Tax=Brassica cretica TaxID=69181 RepID=A0A8S9FH42_BRACR|nr:hypothetical protein F2Q70_00030601 [Brassica cretica]
MFLSSSIAEVSSFFNVSSLPKAVQFRPNLNSKRLITGQKGQRIGYKALNFQGMDTFRWNKGSLVMSNSSGQRGGEPGSPGGVVLEKHKTLKSVGNLSIGSAVSTASGRKPFNRYV